MSELSMRIYNYVAAVSQASITEKRAELRRKLKVLGVLKLKRYNGHERRVLEGLTE